MNEGKKTANAVEILRRRYVGEDPERQAAIEAARVHAEVARTVYELRTDAGLSQEELAELIGTTQSVISRLEDEEYDGHSLSMLNRIARALNQKLAVVMTAKDPQITAVRYAFQLAVQTLRKQRGLSIDKLAALTGIDRGELIAVERNPGYRPTPLTLHKLSKFYKVPEERLAALAGAFQEAPHEVTESALRYAAQSESFAQLTKEERKAFDQFIQTLKSEK
ncbi:MAG: helix-turn-helix transcriptional regulator [Candidatus Brocadiia bacterium]